MKTNYSWISETKDRRWHQTPSYMTNPDFYTYSGQTNNAGFEVGQRWNAWARKAKYGPKIHGDDIKIVKQEKVSYSQNKVNEEEQIQINTMRKVARDATTVGIHVINCNRQNPCKETYEAGTINKLLYNQVMKQVGAWALWKIRIHTQRKHSVILKRIKQQFADKNALRKK